MSVLTEIQRLTNAAAAIASAIAAKGVTVPSGTKLDGMAALINSILTRKPEQTKSCTPSESAQTISPDSGYVLSSVSVGAISSTYVGSGVTRQAAKTVTPSTSSQTAVASGRYTTGAVTVAAIPNQKSDSGNVTLNASTTSKSYAAGYYANAHGAQVTVYDGTVV